MGNIAQPGLIICCYGRSFDVEDQAGYVRRCAVRSKLVQLMCGDRVMWEPTHDGQGVITDLLPRRTLLARSDSRGKLKPLAANLDQLLLVIAPRDREGESELKLDTLLIDRYLVAATLSKLAAAIIINKADLLDHAALELIDQRLADYRAIGYATLYTSIKLPSGTTALPALLKRRASAFCGPSGVGKSSLIKALLPEQDIRVGVVSATTGTGMHTTTYTTLFHLPDNAAIIDSPGVRDFGPWQVAKRELAGGFPEFSDHAQHCRFADCLHMQEPGCSVEEAAQQGNISRERLRNYRHMVAESRQD